MVPVISAAILVLVAQPHVGPTLPIGCNQHIHQLNTKVQLLLSQSKFTEALTALDSWPSGEIGYSADGMPESYRAALEAGVKVWSQTVDGKVKFVRSNKPLVRLTFLNVDGETLPEPSWKDGQLIAPIPISIGPAKSPATKHLFAWSVAKAFGYALGMQSHTRRYHVMGQIVFLPEGKEIPTISPHISEKALLETLLQTKDELRKAALEKRPLTIAAPHLEVDKVSQDGGTVTQGNKVRFEFKLRNSGNARLVLEQETTCHCVVVVPIAAMEPGQTVTLAADVDTRDAVGLFERTITIYSNDPIEPIRQLTVTVNSVSEYRILPEGMQVVNVADEGPTSLALTVYATPGNNAQVVSAQSGNEHVQASVIPWSGEIVDPMFGDKPIQRKGSQVKLTIDPKLPAGIDFARIVIVTDSKRTPYRDMLIELHKGIFAQPKTAFFGTIAVGQNGLRTVTVEHATKAFNITGISAQAPFTATYKKAEGSDRSYVVTVEFKPAKAGYVTGVVTVKTDSPLYPKIEIPVSGNVQ
jgi:hypothetical protein